MTRPIDADELYTVLVKMNDFGELSAKKAVRMVSKAPTVDAVPVKHGHGKWIDEGYYADNTNVKAWHCSECNWHMLGYEDELFRYCPMCGARMEEE